MSTSSSGTEPQLLRGVDLDLNKLDAARTRRRQEEIVRQWLSSTALTLPQLEALDRWLDRRGVDARSGRTIAIAFVGTYVGIATAGVSVLGFQASPAVGAWLSGALLVMGAGALWSSRVATRTMRLQSEVDMQRAVREDAIATYALTDHENARSCQGRNRSPLRQRTLDRILRAVERR
jgi:hypothetical protein